MAFIRGGGGGEAGAPLISPQPFGSASGKRFYLEMFLYDVDSSSHSRLLRTEQLAEYHILTEQLASSTTRWTPASTGRPHDTCLTHFTALIITFPCILFIDQTISGQNTDWWMYLAFVSWINILSIVNSNAKQNHIYMSSLLTNFEYLYHSDHF